MLVTIIEKAVLELSYCVFRQFLGSFQLYSLYVCPGSQTNQQTTVFHYFYFYFIIFNLW